MEKIALLAVGGPTASGKTRLAVDLALGLGGEVICADSMQVYRDMPIGTASPTPEERGSVPHHLFNFLDPTQHFSVAQYVALARPVIADIAKRGKLPILCGGTGLYLSALLDNLQFWDTLPQNAPLRRELRALAREKGGEAVWQILAEADPETAQKLHPNNLGRVIRAIEVFRASGIPMSEWQRRSRGEESPYRACLLALNYADRALLYQRINRRVELMLEQGLLEEARRVLRHSGGTAAQAIGHKELAGHLQGAQTLEEATATLQQQTRRYAKRQLTWLRKMDGVHWLEPDAFPDYPALLAAALALAGSALNLT